MYEVNFHKLTENPSQPSNRDILKAICNIGNMIIDNQENLDDKIDRLLGKICPEEY